MNKQILRLAIPNIISNLSVPLLSSVDTALLGHLDKISYLGALAVGSIIFNFVYWGFGFLRMGTTGLTAQAYGNENQQEVKLILIRTLLFALAGGLLLILSQQIIAVVSFKLIDASYDVQKYGLEYFYIRIYAAPATLALYAFHGWFLGMQNAKYPLILTVVVNVINIFFDFLFIYRFHMTADGVALGTVIAQYGGLLLATILFLKKYTTLDLRKNKSHIFNITAVKRLFKVNSDIFIRTLCLIFALSYFTAKSAQWGDEILAANTILMQLIIILAYGIDGFAFSSESLVGKYIGAADRSNLKKTIRFSFYWGIGMGVCISLIYFLFGTHILRIFTDQENVVQLAMNYFSWVIIAPLINGFCFIWDGVFIGATATKAMRNSMIFCTFLIYLPVYFVFHQALGNHSLWLALTVFMIMRGVTLTIYSRKYIYQAIPT